MNRVAEIPSEVESNIDVKAKLVTDNSTKSLLPGHNKHWTYKLKIRGLKDPETQGPRVLKAELYKAKLAHKTWVGFDYGRLESQHFQLTSLGT